MSESEQRPKADQNPNDGPAKRAVALKYNADKDAAPVVIAAGYGPIAERIIDIAEQRGIPVYRDDSAASMLCMLGVGANIPEELYQVVATIYSQILRAASRLQKGDVPDHTPADAPEDAEWVDAELTEGDPHAAQS